jgi:hypothetical protein
LGVYLGSAAVNAGGFTFNTIGLNGTALAVAAAAGMQCGGPQVIENSIVIENTKDVSGSQFFDNNCILNNVVVGDDTITSNGKLTGVPVFLNDTNAPDLRLNVTDPTSLAANQSCCIDKVTMPGPSPSPAPLPTIDVELQSRPQGLGYDIGADEAK